MTTPEGRPLCQPQEMHLPHRHSQISRLHPVSRWTTHGSGKSLHDPVVAGTMQYPRSPVLPGIHQLLPMIHQPLCGTHPTTHYPLLEEYPLAFWNIRIGCFPMIENGFPLSPSSLPLGPRPTNDNRDICFQLCHCRNPFHNYPGFRDPSNPLPFLIPP